MSKKKQFPSSPKDHEFMDEMLFDEQNFGDEVEMLNTFGHVTEATIEHMKVACRLTKIIIEHQKNDQLTSDEILNIFRKASETILDCTPLKALFEKP